MLFRDGGSCPVLVLQTASETSYSSQKHFYEQLLIKTELKRGGAFYSPPPSEIFHEGTPTKVENVFIPLKWQEALGGGRESSHHSFRRVLLLRKFCVCELTNRKHYPQEISV